MKQKRTLLFVIGACAVSSLIMMSSAWARPIDPGSRAISKDNFNIIYDEAPTNSATVDVWDYRTDTYRTEDIKYTSVYNFISKSNNPATLDSISVAICIAVTTVSFVLALLFAKTRRGFSKGSCFALVLSGTGLLSGVLGLAQSNGVYAEEHSIETISIKDKAFYDAFKACFTDPYLNNIESPRYRWNNHEGLYYDSEYYDCEYLGSEGIVYDDAAQTVTLDPYYVSSIDLHDRGITDISDLLNFNYIKYFFAYNNNISDISILNLENFPKLSYSFVMDYNRIPDLDDNNEYLFSYGTLWAQSIDTEADSEGNVSIPGMFARLMDYAYGDNFVHMAERESFDVNNLKIPVHVYNIELSDDMGSARVLRLGDKAYLGFSAEEMDDSYYKWIRSELEAKGIDTSGPANPVTPD